MSNYLKLYSITQNSHFLRLYGYSKAIGGSDYTELNAQSSKPKPRARLSTHKATQRQFVKTRQPFSIVEINEF